MLIQLAELHSFAIYFNTDSDSIAKLPQKESADKFRSLVRSLNMIQFGARLTIS